MLKWICRPARRARPTRPRPRSAGCRPGESLDTDGLDISDAAARLLLSVDAETWREEAALVKPHYERFGDHLPSALWDQLDQLNQRLAYPAALAERPDHIDGDADLLPTRLDRYSHLERPAAPPRRRDRTAVR